MFESNEDFNIDDDFLLQFNPSQITASSTQRTQSSCIPGPTQFSTTVHTEAPPATLDDEFDHIFANFDFDRPKPTCKRSITEITNTVSKRQKTEEPKIKTEKIVLKRAFPGPAGLLPKYPQNEDLFKDNEDQSPTVISQDPENKFNGAWKQMLEDYTDPNVSFPRKYTIAWLKAVSVSTTISSKKAPFLAVVIDEIYDKFNLKLIDEFEKIDGIIDREAFDKYAGDIRIGNVIVLRNVGVITLTLGKPYLTISSNNIVCFYNDDKVTKTDRFLNRDDFREMETNLENTHIQSPSSKRFSNTSNSRVPLNFGDRIAAVNRSPSVTNRFSNTSNNQVLPKFGDIRVQPNFEERIASVNGSRSVPERFSSTSNNRVLPRVTEPFPRNDFESAHSSVIRPGPTSFKPCQDVTTRNQQVSNPTGTLNRPESSQRSTFSATPMDPPSENKLRKKLNEFVFKPRYTPDVANTQGSMAESEIETIINNTFDGFDAETLFDDDF